MKNYSKTAVILTAMALGVSLNSCKKNDKVEPEEVISYYDITDVYPDTNVIDIDTTQSTASVDLTKKDTPTAEVTPPPPAKEEKKKENSTPAKTKKTTPTNSNNSNIAADVGVKDGNLITDDDEIVGGFISLDFNDVMASPTGNVVADVDVVKGNLVADDSDGIMDVHIDSVEELDEVLVKDGIENTHMMKGVVKMNGKTQDFEVPVDINKADDKFELVGIVDFDRSQFYSDKAFNHLTADDLMNDNVKVRVHVNSKGTAGSISIYDADKKIKEKAKFKEHNDHVLAKVKEKGDGFKDKDNIMEQHDKKIEKLKEKGNGTADKLEIEEVNGETIEKLTHRQKRLERHKERLEMQKSEIAEKYKDSDKETGEKEVIKIDQKIGEVDAQLKEIDDSKNRLKVSATSTDGGLS